MARTLAEARAILTVRNRAPYRYDTDGPIEPGARLVVLQPNRSGHYLPSRGFFHHKTPTGRFAIDLWEYQGEKTERVVVTKNAVLWYPEDAE